MIDEGKLPLISVIVPVYNVQKYLAKCMDSLLSQTYGNYEIILVDDGSEDKSGKLCDEYGKKHKIVKVIHQENGGLSLARNSGVKISEGEYVTFVDSDDYVTETYLSDLYKLIREFDSDMAIISICRLLDNMTISDKALLTVQEYKKCMTNVEALEAMYYGNGFGVSSCAKLYKADIVKKNEFPVGYLCEDQIATYKLVEGCKRIAESNKIGYFHVQRLGSITHTSLQKKDIQTLDAFKEQITYISNVYPELSQAVICKYADLLVQYVYRLKWRSHDDRQLYMFLRKEMESVIKRVLSNKDVPIILKIKCVILLFGYHVNKFSCKIINILRDAKIKYCMK